MWGEIAKNKSNSRKWGVAFLIYKGVSFWDILGITSMEKDSCKELIQNLIRQGKELSPRRDGMFVNSDQISQCQEWFSDILGCVKSIASENSFYFREAERIIKGSKRMGGIFWNEIQMMKGHLASLSHAIDEGYELKDAIRNSKEIKEDDEILKLKPDFYGVGIDLKKAWRWIKNLISIKKYKK